MLIAQDKGIVIPGETLAENDDYTAGPGTYKEGTRIVSSQLGLVSIMGKSIRLIPLSGRYIPKTGDTIICKVIDVSFSGWRLDTYSAYSAMLSSKEATSEFINRGADLTRYYDVGDYLVAKIINVTSQKLVDVTMRGPGLRKLDGGRIIEVNTNKVPRIIGKGGSMVSMISQATGCKIIVGQNGLIWISGDPAGELLSVQVIKKIERESHLSGLTDKMKAFLDAANK